MNIENLSTLKIHRMSQKKYDEKKLNNELEENAIYLTPEEALEFDKTLSKSGVAADAKAVGDALTQKQPIGDYVEQNELDSAIQNAFDQALEDGLLRGEDGVSCTHEWDGTILTVTSASGTSSADLKGESPTLRINEETNEWEVSYGEEFTSLGVKATGECEEVPVFVLKWYEGTDSSGNEHPTEEEKQTNIDIIKQVRNLSRGAYNLYLDIGAGVWLPVLYIHDNEFLFMNPDTEGDFPVYTIFYRSTSLGSSYRQDKTYHIASTFDENSHAAPSMVAVANYVDDRLAEFPILEYNIVTDDEVMELLSDLRIVEPTTTASGEILTSGAGEIYTL